MVEAGERGRRGRYWGGEGGCAGAEEKEGGEEGREIHIWGRQRGVCEWSSRSSTRVVVVVIDREQGGEGGKVFVFDDAHDT